MNFCLFIQRKILEKFWKLMVKMFQNILKAICDKYCQNVHGFCLKNVERNLKCSYESLLSARADRE